MNKPSVFTKWSFRKVFHSFLLVLLKIWAPKNFHNVKTTACPYWTKFESMALKYGYIMSPFIDYTLRHSKHREQDCSINHVSKSVEKSLQINQKSGQTKLNLLRTFVILMSISWFGKNWIVTKYGQYLLGDLLFIFDLCTISNTFITFFKLLINKLIKTPIFW